MFLVISALLTNSEGQPSAAVADNATYWDAVYTEAAGVKNFGHAWQGLDWASLKTVLEFDIRPEDRTLVLGAGDSGLAQEVFDAGCRHVTAVDFSAVLVSAMSERSHGVIWSVGEASNLSFSDSSFDVVLDIGLLDTIGVAGESQMLKVVEEAHRLLSPGAVYVSSSTEPPLFRLPLFAPSFGGNATKVLFVPRPRELDHRVRRVDAALDLGKVSVYVSKKLDVSINAQGDAELSEKDAGAGAGVGMAVSESTAADGFKEVGGEQSTKQEHEESILRDLGQDIADQASMPDFHADSQKIIAGDGHIEQANFSVTVEESLVAQNAVQAPEA